MGQTSHDLDVEAMLADRAAAAERIGREVDEVIAAAAEKRGAYIDWTIANLRGGARRQPDAPPRATPPDGEAARLLVASGRAADDGREASRAEALRTLTEARKASALVEAQTERERAALAEMQDRRAQVEREAEELLAETGRVEGEMKERRARAEREAEELLAQARAEADRVLAGAGQERRVQVEREAEETLAQARAVADRVAAETEERRGQVAREEEEIRSRAQEADRIVAAAEEERQRVRKLLAGAIASLDVDAKAVAVLEDPVEYRASQLPETTESTTT